METQSIQFTRDVTYALRPASQPKGICLLLHGYLQTGHDILKLMAPYLPQDWTLLAPNGLFPVAQGQGQQIHLRYSWYFFNPNTNEYLISMEPACQYLKAFMSSHSSNGLPVKVIGYSQGGYLAPVAAQALPTVQQVIGINCRFRAEILREPLSFRLDGIHGLDDVLVDPNRARQCHQDVMNKGNAGEFVGVEKAGHRFTAPMGAALQAIWQ